MRILHNFISGEDRDAMRENKGNGEPKLASFFKQRLLLYSPGFLISGYNFFESIKEKRRREK